MNSKATRYTATVAKVLGVKAYLVTHGINSVAFRFTEDVDIKYGSFLDWNKFCEDQFRLHMKEKHGVFP